MIDLKSMNLEEMSVFFKEMGQPAFRAKQVFQWLHRGVRSFDEMSNLPKALREELSQRCYITVPEGAVAVNIPMASNADTWEIYLRIASTATLRKSLPPPARKRVTPLIPAPSAVIAM